MAYKPILQAALEYMPRGFLPGITVVSLTALYQPSYYGWNYPD